MYNGFTYIFVKKFDFLKCRKKNRNLDSENLMKSLMLCNP